MTTPKMERERRFWLGRKRPSNFRSHYGSSMQRTSLLSHGRFLKARRVRRWMWVTRQQRRTVSRSQFVAARSMKIIRWGLECIPRLN